MREIKFRAWDKIDNHMRYQNDVEGIKEWPSLLAVGFHGLPICIDNDSFKDNEIIGWNRDHNLFLMQYTGLKDKNGKEIYEGDIVKGINYGFNNPSRFIGTVEYRYNGYKVVGTPKYKGMNDELNTIYEVIGNIYENPNLVEGENNGIFNA
jgi:uncharacterized phage protein (TIGR01671 family)